MKLLEKIRATAVLDWIAQAESARFVLGWKDWEAAIRATISAAAVAGTAYLMDHIYPQLLRGELGAGDIVIFAAATFAFTVLKKWAGNEHNKQQ